MATKQTDSLTLTAGTLTTGLKNPASLTKWPELGATVTVRAPGATSGSPAIVELRVWTDASAKEVLATFTLPVPAVDDAGNANANAGALFDSLPAFSTWDDFEYNVVAIGAATSIVCSVTGVGV